MTRSEKKAKILQIIGAKPQTIHDCAAAMGLEYEQIRYLVTELIQEQRLFAVGHQDRRSVMSTDPDGSALSATQQKIVDLLTERGPMPGMSLVPLLGITVSRTYEALRVLQNLKRVYVVSKDGKAQIYAAGDKTSDVPRRTRRSTTKAERLATRARLEERRQVERLATFERQRQEGIAKNARMLPFAW